MSVESHRISDEAFRALASGAGGATALAGLRAAQYSKHLMLLRAVVERFPAEKSAADAFRLLAELEDDAPEAVAAVVRYPAVGVWAAQALRGKADPGRLAAVALAAFLRAGQECRMVVSSHQGWITLPSVGGFPARGRVEVGVKARGVTVDHMAPQGWRPLPCLDAPGFTVTVDDLDPHRWPDGIELPRLREAEQEEWRVRLGAAWQVLTDNHWTVQEEVKAAVAVFTPIATVEGRPQSESCREAFGAIALSVPVDGVTLAETLAHEIQHVKLYALMDIEPLVMPDPGDRFYAPWRPDPRPVSGLLNGTYAYLGVTGFWRRQRRAETGEHAARAELEFALWREAAYQTTEVLLTANGLTSAGVAFTEGMRDTLSEWLGEPVDISVLGQVRRKLDNLRRTWEERTGRLSR